MLVYSLTTIITCALVYIESKLPKQIGKTKLLSLIAVLIFCIVAGARDTGVGTDTTVYGENLFTWVHNHGFIETFAMNEVIKIEYGFMIMLYGITRLTEHVFWYYFAIEFIGIVFVNKTLDYMELGRYKWIGLFIYNTLFFSFSLNLMRQSIAMGISLYSYRFIKEHKPMKYLLTVFLAILFHRTAIITITTYIIHTLCGLGDLKKRKSIVTFLKQYRFILITVILISAVAVLLFSKQLIIALAVIRPSYNDQAENIGSYNPSIAMLLMMLVLLLPMIIMKVWKWKRKPEYTFYLTTMILSTILWQLQGISSEMYRVTFYIWVLIIIIIPDFIKKLHCYSNRIFFSIYYVLAGGFYYWFVFIYRLTNGTYPYTSKLLGIS